MVFKVEYSQGFINTLKKLSDAELQLIGNFITSLNSSGFKSLPGRNKPSTGVSERHVQRAKLIQYAIKNKLWHYHVGHVEYNQSKKFGDWTSQYVVHYQKNTITHVRFVAYDGHPPFRLPKEQSLL